MKTHAIYDSIILVACVLGTTICMRQSNIVFYGANSTHALNTIFEDAGASAEKAVTAHMRTC